MSPERWKRVREVFEAALASAAGERASLIDRACAGDVELRREVESLLASHQSAGGFLEHGAGALAAPPADTPMPTRLGRYEVSRLLGRGGMGVVYLARDPSLDRMVAVKLLGPEFARDRERLERFEREARVLAALNHPNIGAIYSLERSDDGAPMLVLEYVDGPSLSDKLEVTGAGALTPEESVRIGLQIARALEGAHGRGVVHRDLKPDNIRLTREGLVKVLDFGLARPLSGASVAGSIVTDPGRIMGTPGYMSPEQARGKAADPRSDLFSLGCLLYTCLAGRMAFGGETAGDCLAAVLKDEPDLGLLPPSTPGVARSLIGRCLAKEPGERPADAAEVRATLEGALGMRAGATIVSGAAPTPTRVRLPRQLSSFVGRDRELARVRELLGSAALVSLTGAGGCGKTRLALRAAEDMAPEFPGGVWFVELGPLADPALVPAALASALGVKEDQRRGPVEAAIERIGSGRHLVILDNCEHVLSAAGSLCETLLRACPSLAVIATSREALGVQGETAFRVPSLGLVPPDHASPTAAQALECESVRLFVERARAARTDYELTDADAPWIARVCRRLDGIPLAIELAAARARVLSAEQIHARLDDRFRLLVGGSRTAVERHQTLRAALDWSYGLLTEDERSMLRALSVFAGGFTLESVLAVCGPGDGAQGNGNEFQMLDLLTHLADKSLVVVDEGGARRGEAPRYRLLETVRQYARERLQEAGAERVVSVRGRHLDRFLALSEQAEPHLIGPAQALWLARLEADHENLIAALEWWIDAIPGTSDDRGVRLAGTLGRFWSMRGHLGLGRGLLERTLARLDPGAASPPVAKAYNSAGSLSYFRGDAAGATRWWTRALGVQRRLGDRRAVAGVLNNLGLVAEQQGRYDEARTLYSEALSVNTDLGNRAWEAINLNNLGNVEWSLGRYDHARPLYERALEINRAVGNRAEEARNLANLGAVAADTGHPDDACDLLERSIRLQRELGDRRGVAASLGILSRLHADADRRNEARSTAVEALTIRRDLDDQYSLAVSFAEVAHLAVSWNDGRTAAQLLGGADRLRRDLTTPVPDSERARAEADEQAARAALGPGDYAAAHAAGSAMDPSELIDRSQAFLTGSPPRTAAGST